MVDTLALGASGSNPMEVQVLSSAPIIVENRQIHWAVFFFSKPEMWHKFTSFYVKHAGQ